MWFCRIFLLFFTCFFFAIVVLQHMKTVFWDINCNHLASRGAISIIWNEILYWNVLLTYNWLSFVAIFLLMQSCIYVYSIAEKWCLSKRKIDCFLLLSSTDSSSLGVLRLFSYIWLLEFHKSSTINPLVLMLSTFTRQSQINYVSTPIKFKWPLTEII